jgi:maltose alpha-D-glucosyltransferase/alpha-amylase
MIKEPAVLVMPAGLGTLLPAPSEKTNRIAERTIAQLEQEILPEFMRERRWFAGKGDAISRARIASGTLWSNSGRTWLIALVQVQLQSGLEQRYFLPMSLAWEDQPDSGVLLSAEWMLAKSRSGPRTGALVDAFADPAFCLAVAQAVEASASVPFGDGELRFTPTRSYAELASGGLEPVQYLGREQSNTSVVLGEHLFLKGYRQSRAGTNPDMEVPRFLTEVGFRAIPPLAGAVEYLRPDEPPVTLAALFAFVRNQGDGWAYALSHLERFATSLVAAPGTQTDAPHALFLSQMHTLGQRIGEMHAALATDTAQEDFKPEPITPDDVSQWIRDIVAEAHVTFELVEKRIEDLSEPVRAVARDLLSQQELLTDRLTALRQTTPQGYKTRYHGDLHLGQVLLVADDFLITDFEGEPARTIEERRRKSSPVRDVAGMLRSFDYARAVAQERAISLRPDLTDRLEPAFNSWHAQTRKAFLKGYRTGSSNARSVPADEASFEQLSTLFEIQKALYEVRYELANRPQWLAVPAQGLTTLVATPTAADD